MVGERNDWKDIIRLLLVLMILYYAPVSNFIAKQDIIDISSNNTETPEESMGGRESVSYENISLLEVNEASVPEPEEFSKPRMLMHTSYTIKKGDVIGEVAKQFGLNIGTLVSVNAIKYTRNIPVGRVLTVPNQDGIVYKVKKDDTLKAVAERYKADGEAIRIANELFSDRINENTSLFLPGATIPWEDIQQEFRPVVPPPPLLTEIFSWPVRGRITSYYGYRRSPFSGRRAFHPGLDIAAPEGTPIKAAMAGRVISVGWDEVYGNFVSIAHQSDFRTLYGHMSEVYTRAGVYVNAGETIGAVGTTGQSTGPHVHLAVYRNGATINPRMVLR